MKIGIPAMVTHYVGHGCENDTVTLITPDAFLDSHVFSPPIGAIYNFLEGIFSVIRLTQLCEAVHAHKSSDFPARSLVCRAVALLLYGGVLPGAHGASLQLGFHPVSLSGSCPNEQQ